MKIKNTHFYIDMKFQLLLPNLLQFIVSIILWFEMSAIVVINERVCLGRGRSQFSVGVALVIKRFHRESDILVDPTRFIFS